MAGTNRPYELPKYLLSSATVVTQVEVTAKETKSPSKISSTIPSTTNIYPSVYPKTSNSNTESDRESDKESDRETNSDISELLWDGSYLGKFDGPSVMKSCVKTTLDSSPGINGTITSTKVFIVKLILGKVTLVAALKKYTNDVPLIIDELKPLFGIKKAGTHTIRLINMANTIYYYNGYALKNTKYVLVKLDYKIENNEPKVIIYNMLTEYDTFFKRPDAYLYSSLFIGEMKKLIVFMHICGIAYRVKSIFIKPEDPVEIDNDINRIYRVTNGVKYIPLLFYTKTLNENTTITALSGTNIHKWFQESELTDDIITDTIVRMLGIYRRSGKFYESDIEAKISDFRDSFVNIFERFPDSSILKYWYIIDYVNSKLYDIPTVDDD